MMLYGYRWLETTCTFKHTRSNYSQFVIEHHKQTRYILQRLTSTLDKICGHTNQATSYLILTAVMYISVNKKCGINFSRPTSDEYEFSTSVQKQVINPNNSPSQLFSTESVLFTTQSQEKHYKFRRCLNYVDSRKPRILPDNPIAGPAFTHTRLIYCSILSIRFIKSLTKIVSH